MKCCCARLRCLHGYRSPGQTFPGNSDVPVPMETGGLGGVPLQPRGGKWDPPKGEIPSQGGDRARGGAGDRDGIPGSECERGLVMGMVRL